MATPVKATIINLSNPGLSVNCQFNPKEFKHQKKNSWKLADAKSQNSGVLNFSGGKPGKITLELLFDTTLEGGDVRSYTQRLLKMMEIEFRDPKTNVGEPPRVRFLWGKIFSFEAVITSINITYKMFRSDGTPVRATAKVIFEESKDDSRFKGQNPTSRSEGREVWEVVEGQTLSWIAYKKYGHPKHWRHIAKANGITNPMALEAGQILEIVELPRQSK